MIHHPNIMHLYDFLESSNNYYLVMQYCNNGDLEEYISKSGIHSAKEDTKFLDEEKAVYYLKQIMNGFQCLHKHRVMHRDFKLANIFLHDETLIIGDFGFAKSGFEMAQTKLGTPLTMAPELQQDSTAYTSKADLWSIGVVYYQMLFGNYPFFAMDMNSLMDKIKRNSGDNLKFDFQVNHISEESQDLLRRLLQQDPDRRIDWVAFFNHPLFNEKNANVQDNSHQGNQFLQAVGKYLAVSKNVDREFDTYKKETINRSSTPIDPSKLNIEKNPDIVNELSLQTNIQDNQSMNQEAIFKENSFRYYHEKNKIMLIFLTVKKLRNLMKVDSFRTDNKTIYLLMLCLAKKGSMLSELTLYSLNFKNNIFKLREFDAYCSMSKECEEAIQLLKQDQPSIFSYHRYIKDRKNEVQLSPDDEGLFSWLEQNYIDLQELDTKAKKLYSDLRSSGVPNEIINNEEALKEYFVCMIFTVYSINSEVYIPYMLNNGKFQWENFRLKYSNLDPSKLAQILDTLNC